MVAPPRHLPTTIDDRRTGATISSRRNPSSRSQTSDAALKIALYTNAMQRTPGNMNVVRSDTVGRCVRERVQPGPEDEQEQQRLDQPRHDAHGFVGESDQVAPPDGAHRPSLRPPGALGHPDGDDIDGRGAHRPDLANTRMMARSLSLLDPLSASRIVVPV